METEEQSGMRLELETEQREARKAVASRLVDWACSAREAWLATGAEQEAWEEIIMELEWRAKTGTRP